MLQSRLFEQGMSFPCSLALNRYVLCILAAVSIGACDASPTLPNGYEISHGGGAKAWLKRPDGTFAHAGLIKDVYADEKHILMIALPVRYGGKAAPPFPLDGNCYVALMIDASTGRRRQIHMAEGKRLAARMSRVANYERPCLQGMQDPPSR